MLTYKELNILSKKLSSIVDAKIHLLHSDDNSFSTSHNYDNFKPYSIRVGEEAFTIYIEKQGALTKREIDIIKVFLEELITNTNHLGLDSSAKEIMKLFSQDLDKQQIANTLVNKGFSEEDTLVVMLIKLQRSNEVEGVCSIIENMSFYKLINVPLENNIIAIVYNDSSQSELGIANILVDTIETELYDKVKIGISTIKPLYEIKEAYEEAIEALDIGITYELPGSIFLYKDLLIYRILSHIPEKVLQKLYSQCINNGLNKLSEDDLKTVEVFLNSNLNLSDTARKLYIHRNTLIYRLDKIQKDTGFDLRTLKDALDFKILLKIYQYMKNKVK